MELKISSVACRLYRSKKCSSTGSGATGYQFLKTMEIDFGAVTLTFDLCFHDIDHSS